MTCEERRDQLLLYVAGALEPGEEAELREHLASGCAACAGALAEAEATFHAIPRALPRQAPPAGAWEKLQSRIALKDQTEAPARAALMQPFAAKPNRWGAWAGWAVAAAVAVMLGLPLMNANDALKKNQAELAAIRVQADRVGPLETQVIDLEQKIKSVGHDNELLQASVQKASTDFQSKLEKLMRSEQYAVAGKEQPAATAKLFWDKVENTWTVYAANVKPSAPGKTYELWAITAAGDKIGIGTADPSPTGNMVMEVKLPPNALQATVIAITDEPAGGLPQPSGQVQLVGTLAKL